MPKILVTGNAGFIGFHTALKLASQGHEVVGLDNINDYYDTTLKKDRLRSLGIDLSRGESRRFSSEKYSNLSFYKLDLTDKSGVVEIFSEERFDYVCHLAAQVGVRYSLEHPECFISSNIHGFMNILEACRVIGGVDHFVFASSSSVYSPTPNEPSKPGDSTDNPISLYAATKKSNELCAHSYSHLCNLPCTGLRLFTVYGPWGRPDMAIYKFT